MNNLIDTNVISELGKKTPNACILEFLRTLPQDSLYLSVITIGEIVKGIEKTDDAKKKNRLLSWFAQVRAWFEGHIIYIDEGIMTKWGKFVANHNRTLPIMDSFLAATCLHQNLRLVTRNIKDFAGINELSIVNPWDESL
ncbi:ribonuclease VapC [Spirochaetia bacterium]|nr:ribonuclease VapC [Spirochaetia bacterium]